MTQLVLASSSQFRQELLSRLLLPFTVLKPEIDESPLKDEKPVDQVRRLAFEKARKIAQSHENAHVIGSDQLAVSENQIFGKPGSTELAIAQLQQMRGKTLIFHTGLCLFNSSNNTSQLDCIDYEVRFRDYSDEEIRRYVDTEQPLNCAGAFKSEALGISMTESMQGPDPTALIGLPLIRLCDMLRREGFRIP